MNGCAEYTRTTVDIFFQKDDVRCKYCPLLQTYSRNQCMRTGELIVDVMGRGMWCPLTIEKEEEHYGKVSAAV